MMYAVSQTNMPLGKKTLKIILFPLLPLSYCLIASLMSSRIAEFKFIICNLISVIFVIIQSLFNAL